MGERTVRSGHLPAAGADRRVEIGQSRGPRRAERRIARRDDRIQNRRSGFSIRRSDRQDFKREAEAVGGSFTAQSTRRVLSGPFYFSASIPADQASAFSRKATESFTSLATAAVSAEELAAAKSALAEEHAARSVENYLREIEAFKTPKNYPLTVKENIEKITAADVQRVAKRLFDANAMTVVALGRVSENFKLNP